MPAVARRRLLTQSGANPDWCRDGRIAFDRTDLRSGREIFISAAGTQGAEACLTCGLDVLPDGARGRAAWHPSCRFLAIQVAEATGAYPRYEAPDWGFGNSAWLIADDGSWAHPVAESRTPGAIRAPLFSSDGGRLLWSERRPTGRPIAQALLSGGGTPGGESPWDGWHIASGEVQGSGEAGYRLVRIARIFREQTGFVEAHALDGETLWYARSPAGAAFSDEIFRSDRRGNAARNLSARPSVWDGQARPSPGGRLLSYISSRESGWTPADGVGAPPLDLWVDEPAGDSVRLTQINAGLPASRRGLVTGYAWNPAGDAVAIAVRYQGQGRAEEKIEILTLNGRY